MVICPYNSLEYEFTKEGRTETICKARPEHRAACQNQGVCPARPRGGLINGYCTKDNPGEDFAFHPDAREVGEQEDGYPGGDIVRYECPHCGARWKEELPQ